MTLRAVHLHGHLKRSFGASHRFDVATAAEAIRALNCAFPQRFAAALSGGSYKIVRGDKLRGVHLDIDHVSNLRLGLADLHIIPVAKGRGNGKGVAKTIVGAALVGGAIFFSGGSLAAPLTIGNASIGMSWGNVAVLGLGLALHGASTLLTKAEAPQDTSRDDSFTISGPKSGGRQGDAIPLIYGECIVPGNLVSFDADIEDIGAYAGQTASMGSSVQVVPGSDGKTIYGAA